ncbi:MAG: hypothetical protein HY696_04630 [Deltaproteobacteria bacterium]|nr:hypothetical protein [Deltaproteobacteria bacterium]
MAPPISRSEACINTPSHHRNLNICFKDANGNGKLDDKDTATVQELDGQGDVQSSKTVSVEDGLGTAAKERYLGEKKPDLKAGAEAMRQLVNGQFQADRGEDPRAALDAAKRAHGVAQGKNGATPLAGDLNRVLFDSYRARATAAMQKGDLAAFDKEDAAFRKEFGIQTEKDDGSFNDYADTMGSLRAECRYNLLMNQAMEQAKAGADWGQVSKLITKARDLARGAERDDLVNRTYAGGSGGKSMGFTLIRSAWAAARAKQQPTKAVGTDK